MESVTTSGCSSIGMFYGPSVRKTVSPMLYRAYVVDSRDHQIIKVDKFIAANDDVADIIAWTKAAAQESLDISLIDYYDIVLERIGSVRPKRDED